MDFFLATKNKNKLGEMKRILEPLGISVLSEADLPYSLPEVEETGTTFEENSMLKAKSACSVTGLPSIADDSGLCVDCLDGAPGVYSARFAGEEHNDEKNIQKLLSLLGDTKERNAHFVCTVSCVFPDGRDFCVRGECHGTIAYEKHGVNGFGYDPVFMYGDKSFAQMSAEEKDLVSHRGSALKQFKSEILNYIKE